MRGALLLLLALCLAAPSWAASKSVADMTQGELDEYLKSLGKGPPTRARAGAPPEPAMPAPSGPEAAKPEPAKPQDPLASVPPELRPDIAAVDELAEAAASPEGCLNRLVALTGGTGKWAPAQAEGLLVGFADGDGWKATPVASLGPRRVSPAGFLMIAAKDGGKAALILDDKAWADSRMFLARAAGGVAREAAEGRGPKPLSGLFLRPVARFTPEGAWQVVDFGYVSHRDWNKAVLFAARYRFERVEDGRATLRGTVGEYAGRTYEQLVAELKARRERAGEAPRTEAFGGWWVERAGSGTLLVTWLEQGAPFGKPAGPPLVLEVDLERKAARPHTPYSKTALLGSAGAGEVEWQPVFGRASAPKPAQAREAAKPAKRPQPPEEDLLPVQAEDEGEPKAKPRAPREGGKDEEPKARSARAPGGVLAEKLLKAALRGNAEGVRELLAAGADPNARDSFGRTCVLLAARKGHARVLRLLLAKGGDLRAGDPSGKTPLMWAALMGNAEAAKVLLARNAEVDAAAADGMTALMLAAQAGHAGVVRALLDAGADPAATGKEGKTAERLALERGHAGVAALLRR